MRTRLLGPIAALVACGESSTPAPPIRFLHTFAAEETELFNATIAEKGIRVESSIVPFARGQQVIGEMLIAGTRCPDLIRIDATWLPALRAELEPVPAALAELDWTPEAAALVIDPAGAAGTFAAVPQAIDGLVVVRDRARPAPISTSIDDLVAAARSATRGPGSGYPLGLRVDGYWLVPWLRAEGVELAISDPEPKSAGIESERSVKALARFAALFGDLAAPPPPAGSETPDELRRWNAGELAYWVTGPWALGAIRDRDRLAVSSLAHAPRGGQLLVVPKCAKRPAEGWKLAAELTDVAFLAKFAETFGTVPTRKSALAIAPQIARDLYAALATTEPLRRDPRTPLLFDDLNPALAAVIAHDATPDEAIAGVRRGWQRLAAAWARKK
ncbi:MAG: extracellular solute-binding protein [Deltaproteobacteria bacterium]|nr:extracellular solute-binding protein [Deltaproteobacteria bacterium]